MFLGTPGVSRHTGEGNMEPLFLWPVMESVRAAAFLPKNLIPSQKTGGFNSLVQTLLGSLGQILTLISTSKLFPVS